MVKTVQPRESGERTDEANEIVEIGLGLPGAGMVYTAEFQLQNRKRRADLMCNPGC